MNFDDTIHTAARIDAIQASDRLERARHSRAAVSVTRQRSRPLRQVGTWLNHVGKWLQGLPEVAEPLHSPGEAALDDLTSRYFGRAPEETRRELPAMGFGDHRIS